MKTLLLALLLLSSLQAATVTVKFDYDFTNAKACTATVATNCLESFEAGPFANGAITQATNIPLPANTTGQQTGITGSMTTDTYGPLTLSVVAVAKDAQGNRITSDPALAVATTEPIRPGAPSGVTITITINIQSQ